MYFNSDIFYKLHIVTEKHIGRRRDHTNQTWISQETEVHLDMLHHRI